jgi:hypothetical protein
LWNLISEREKVKNIFVEPIVKSLSYDSLDDFYEGIGYYTPLREVIDRIAARIRLSSAVVLASFVSFLICFSLLLLILSIFLSIFFSITIIYLVYFITFLLLFFVNSNYNFVGFLIALFITNILVKTLKYITQGGCNFSYLEFWNKIIFLAILMLLIRCIFHSAFLFDSQILSMSVRIAAFDN